MSYSNNVNMTLCIWMQHAALCRRARRHPSTSMNLWFDTQKKVPPLSLWPHMSQVTTPQHLCRILGVPWLQISQGSMAPKQKLCALDGSEVLLQSLSENFCGVSLQELLCRYFRIVTGEASEKSIDLPILHRLSHIKKNAKGLCKKQ